jgi:hypothetical protein
MHIEIEYYESLINKETKQNQFLSPQERKQKNDVNQLANT